MEIDHCLSKCSQAALSLIGKRKTSLFQFFVLGLGIQYQNKVFLGKLGEWNQWLAEANRITCSKELMIIYEECWIIYCVTLKWQLLRLLTLLAEISVEKIFYDVK